MFSLAGKAVVVTGGGRGIGRGITLAMARAGASVVLVGRTREWLESAEAEARALGARALAVQCDITDADDRQRIVREAQAAFGYIDCWVNNAGNAAVSDFGRLLEIDDGQWNRVVDLNFKATFFACQTAARAMTRGGSIINITSHGASRPSPMVAHYAAAKAGVEALTKSMAAEWGHLGIRVNAVAPGIVQIERTENTPASRRKRQIELIAVRRIGRIDDIGAACVYLASDEASYLSGVVIPVDGGSEVTAGYLSYLWRANQEAEAGEAGAASAAPPS